MQFQIKGQDYFLAFVEDEARWYVFAPTPTGVHRIPVYVDAPVYECVGSSGTTFRTESSRGSKTQDPSGSKDDKV